MIADGDNATMKPIEVPPIKKLREVRVRMYRPGFGDCFLLTFKNTDNQQHHMLIDFGCHQNHPAEKELHLRIAENIRRTTRGRLHTLVATHEHADHRSGFADAAEVFTKFSYIQEIWMPWTSDLGDPLVRDIIKPTQKRYCLAARAAVQRLAYDQAEPILNIMGFQEDAECSTNWIWERLQPVWKKTKFLEPDDLIGFPDFGIKIYVLGPARKLYQPKKNTQFAFSEAGTSLSLSQTNTFLAAAFHQSGLSANEPGGTFTDDDIRELFTLSLPFDPARAYLIKDLQARMQQYATLQEAATGTDDWELFQLLDFYVQHYGAKDQQGHGEEWRRIDHDWLYNAAMFALALDSNINLTSLVLAIELEESGQVLLFPGDAELQSWRTWHNKHTDIASLLRRTVLYKVGHHGSHNATLWEAGKGLCLMNSPKLTAMVPVDEAWARSEKVRWNMPYPPLYQELHTRTHGRILRADLGIPQRPGDYAEQDWQDQFLDYVAEDTKEGLWVQYTIPG